MEIWKTFIFYNFNFYWQITISSELMTNCQKKFRNILAAGEVGQVIILQT